MVPTGAVATASGRNRAAIAWEVRIESDDELSADDVARVVQAGTDDRRVAVVAPGGSDRGARFLLAALAASGHAEPLVLDAATAWPSQPVDCLVLLDPGSLPSALARRVARYAEDGGGILTFVGPRTLRAGALPLLGETSADVFDLDRRVLVRDGGHPLAAGEWDSVTVARALALLALPTRTRRTILALVPEEGGSAAGEVPLLVEQRLGRGRMVTLLTALDRSWSSLVLRPAFVGLVANAVDDLAGEFARSGLAGAPIRVASASVQLFAADGERVLALDETSGGAGSTLRLREPGFYTVRTPGKQSLLAINVDLRESDFAAMPGDVLGRWREAGARRAPAIENEPGMPAEPGPGLPLAPVLLGLAFILLVAEAIAANVGRVDRMPLIQSLAARRA